jgi:hypothetical protein
MTRPATAAFVCLWLMLGAAAVAAESEQEVLAVPMAELPDDTWATLFAADQRAALVGYVECLKQAHRSERLSVHDAALSTCSTHRAAYTSYLPEGIEASVLQVIDHRVSRDLSN